MSELSAPPPAGGRRTIPTPREGRSESIREYDFCRRKFYTVTKFLYIGIPPPFGGEGSTMFSCTRDDPLRGSSLPPFGGVGSLPQRGSEPSLANSGAIRSDGRKNPTEDASPAPGGTGLRPSRGKPVPPGAGDALGIGVPHLSRGLPRPWRDGSDPIPTLRANLPPLYIYIRGGATIPYIYI